MPEGMCSAGMMPFTGVYAPYRGGWYEAAKMHRAWMEAQPWFRAAAARDFLFDGTLLKPAKLTCATKRTAFLSAGCYTRPQDGKVVVQKARMRPPQPCGECPSMVSPVPPVPLVPPVP